MLQCVVFSANHTLPPLFPPSLFSPPLFFVPRHHLLPFCCCLFSFSHLVTSRLSFPFCYFFSLFPLAFLDIYTLPSLSLFALLLRLPFSFPLSLPFCYFPSSFSPPSLLVLPYLVPSPLPSLLHVLLLISRLSFPFVTRFRLVSLSLSPSPWGSLLSLLPFLLSLHLTLFPFLPFSPSVSSLISFLPFCCLIESKHSLVPT